MAKQRNENLTWNEVDVDSMTPKMKKAYAAYKAASATAGELRKSFNEMFKDSLKSAGQAAEDQTILVAHNFGKLSFALSDEPEKASRKAVGKFSFK